MYESIDRAILRHVKLSPEQLDVFHRMLKPRSFRKKTFLLQEGEVCNFEGFIIKGCIRSYFLDENGQETILMFAVEDWWVGDLASFSEQKPSSMYIEALEDSEILTIDHQSKDELFRKVPQFERFFRIIIQRSLVTLQQRYFDSVSKPARERYEAFVSKYPNILQRVPQHQIARYLGISPEFLSKIRGELSRTARP